MTSLCSSVSTNYSDATVQDVAGRSVSEQDAVKQFDRPFIPKTESELAEFAKDAIEAFDRLTNVELKYVLENCIFVRVKHIEVLMKNHKEEFTRVIERYSLIQDDNYCPGGCN